MICFCLFPPIYSGSKKKEDPEENAFELIQGLFPGDVLARDTPADEGFCDVSRLYIEVAEYGTDLAVMVETPPARPYPTATTSVS